MNINPLFKFRVKLKLYQILYVSFVIVYIIFVFIYVYYLKTLNIF